MEHTGTPPHVGWLHKLRPMGLPIQWGVCLETTDANRGDRVCVRSRKTGKSRWGVLDCSAGWHIPEPGHPGLELWTVRFDEEERRDGR